MDAELLNWTRRRLVVTKSLPMKLMITKSRMCLEEENCGEDVEEEEDAEDELL